MMLSQLNFWSYLPKDVLKFENEKIDERNENLLDSIDEKETSSNSEKAREWGHYFLEVGKIATNIAVKQVSSTAKQIRHNVSEIGIIEQSNIIGKFSDEQLKFKKEKRLLEKKSQETCLPWIDALNALNDGEEHVLKSKILSVSSDERNFLRNPPPGCDFEFNYELQSQVALLLLKEDDNLAVMRYNLVPKRIKEDIFWRNYFYRVFLIKQSLQADFKLKDNTAEDVPTDTSESKKMREGEDTEENGTKKELTKQEINQVRNEMLKSTEISSVDGRSDNDAWEAELQKELSEFELINEENSVAEDKGDYDDLEREILSELEK